MHLTRHEASQKYILERMCMELEVFALRILLCYVQNLLVGQQFVYESLQPVYSLRAH